MAHAQHVFNGTSLSKALIELDQSTKRYDISFVYDELEDFTVTKTIKRGRSVPDAVREVCGFYPVRVSVKGHDILVECIRKDRTKLMGRLVGPDRQPVAYANIALFSPSDTSYIGGGVSNEAGDFVIPCSATQAKVRISYVGFKTIERQMTIDNVGTIRMQMENNYLSNINVSGKLHVIRNKADRLQYIVSNDEFARGLNAQELLSRVPMVTMTGGQAMILGKGPARFMINGHITEMGDETIQQKLWTMRSEDIDRIEVLSIPSGRDMIEMGGGYINIVMCRDQTSGWRGDISTEAGYSDDLSGRANGSVIYASEKFDMTIDAHGGRTTQTTVNKITYNIEEDCDFMSSTHAKQTDKEFAANLTFRYQPSKNLEFGGMLSWQTQWPEKVINGVVNAGGSIIDSEAHQDPDDNTTTKSLTTYCDWRFDSKGNHLSLTYSDYKKDDDGKSKVSSITTMKGFESDVDYHIQSARLDLTLPFPFATIDVGGSYTDIRNHANINTQQFNTLSSVSYEGDILDYQEKTKAAYLSLRHDWDKFAIKAGLRYEHIGWDEDAKVNSTIRYLGLSAMINEKSKDYWLPSLSLSYKVEGHQINIEWGESCVRPNFYDLNPFRIYKSAFEYSGGNPLLRPSRISDIELNYHNNKGIYACAYHHHGSHMVMRVSNISMFDDSKYQTETTPLNIGRINQTGLYLRYQRPLSVHLMATAEADAFHHDATAQYEDMDCHLKGWGTRLAVSSDWYLNSQHTLLLNVRYQHWFADYRDMTKTDSYGYFNFALRYAMLDDRLKLSIVANDPFRQHVTNEAIWSNMSSYSDKGFVIRQLSQYPFYSRTLHHSHYISFTATYTFGGNKVHHIHHDIDNTESKRAEKQKTNN